MARVALAFALVSKAVAEISISGSGFSVASESVVFLSTGSCDNNCTQDGETYTCRGRVTYLLQQGTPQSDAIQQVDKECSGQCSCSASDFGPPSPPPPPGPGDNCHAIDPTVSDKWCNDNCHASPPNCPAALCVCGGPAPGPGPSPSPTPPPAPWPPAPGPDGPCSAAQNASGCAACSNSAQCNTCKDGYVLDKVICSPKACGIVGCETCSSDSNNLRGSQCTKCAPNYYGADCTPWYSMKGPEVIRFYNYRAADNQSYPFGNCDGASAMGVIGYLHHEVVGLLEIGPDGKMYPTRKFGIDRIKRQLITMKNPPAVYDAHQSQFGPWNPFDKAQCSSTDPNDGPGCKNRWATYGYNVGCLKTPFNPVAKGEQYYDFPAACPVQNYTMQTSECKAEYPGGQCLVPDGRRECTWKEEDAGEIMLSNLEGIPETQWKTWEAFRAARVCEFDKAPGQCQQDGLIGKGLPFWDNIFSWIAQQKRAQTLMDQFKTKYPDSDYIGDPTCDW
eukprot:gnl/MRDRNA2_/MRDRNA2_98464_c0_seq1.p1 gnl/MRDRNA2_/MRDRNA2_98464_c0~~gnl/MRDRNA2_/MRDRNA2_98464_c0_seq1.p1  ORF type:complete len:504 (+),score=78.01 gnl/MRDRNA2_/MRDRNA2_98464_c0_seq1:94-1605(+)